MEDIVKKYPDVVASDEALRKYVMGEHHRSAIRYLILGSDVDKIPIHPVPDIPFWSVFSDNYYSTEENSILPNFSVGRFPVSDAAAMSKLVNTLLSYREWYSEKRKNAVFSAHQDALYKECLDEIAGQVSGVVNVIKRYAGESSKEELISAINQGAGFINYRGHGMPTEWTSSIGLNNDDIPGLTVGQNISHVLSIACYNNKINEPNCFGATWIRNGKAVSFLGASTESPTIVNQSFNKYLWEAISTGNFSIIGDIYISAILALYKNDTKGEQNVKIAIQEYLLLGDPTADYLENGANSMWKKGKGRSIPLDAPVSGYEGELSSFIARAEHQGGVQPGKYVIGFGCFIPYFGVEFSKEDFEYYTGPVKWVKSSGHNIPANAVVGGQEQDGKLLYIGRALYNGMLVPGKIVANVGQGIYIPYFGKEIELPAYEILVSA
jgi:hypothetical protein